MALTRSLRRVREWLTSVLARRVAATGIDFLLWLLCCWVLLSLDGRFSWTITYDGVSIGLWILVASMVAWDTLFDRSPGKALAGLTIRSGDAPFPRTRVFLRALVFWLLMLAPVGAQAMDFFTTALSTSHAIMLQLAALWSIILLVPLTVVTSGGRLGVHDLVAGTSVGLRRAQNQASAQSWTTVFRQFAGCLAVILAAILVVEWKGNLVQSVASSYEASAVRYAGVRTLEGAPPGALLGRLQGGDADAPLGRDGSLVPNPAFRVELVVPPRVVSDRALARSVASRVFEELELARLVGPANYEVTLAAYRHVGLLGVREYVHFLRRLDREVFTDSYHYVPSGTAEPGAVPWRIADLLFESTQHSHRELSTAFYLGAWEPGNLRPTLESVPYDQGAYWNLSDGLQAALDVRLSDDIGTLRLAEWYVEFFPLDAWAWNALGRIREREQWGRDGLFPLRRAVSLSPQNVLYRHRYAESLFVREYYQMLVEFVDEGVAVGAASYDQVRLAAGAHVQLLQLAEARAKLELLRETFPELVKDDSLLESVEAVLQVFDSLQVIDSLPNG